MWPARTPNETLIERSDAAEANRDVATWSSCCSACMDPDRTSGAPKPEPSFP
jgi:hypothetical protein